MKGINIFFPLVIQGYLKQGENIGTSSGIEGASQGEGDIGFVNYTTRNEEKTGGNENRRIRTSGTGHNRKLLEKKTQNSRRQNLTLGDRKILEDEWFGKMARRAELGKAKKRPDNTMPFKQGN